MLNWSPAIATASIVREFDAANPFSKRTWIAKLGKTNSVRAAEKLCELLDSRQLQKSAGKAIGQLGEVAEPALVEKVIADLKYANANKPISKTLDAKLGYLFELVVPVVSAESKKRLQKMGAIPALSESTGAAWEKLKK